jgi:hypothetical protein
LKSDQSGGRRSGIILAIGGWPARIYISNVAFCFSVDNSKTGSPREPLFGGLEGGGVFIITLIRK